MSAISYDFLCLYSTYNVIKKELEALQSLNQNPFFLVQQPNDGEFWRFGPINLLILLELSNFFAESLKLYTNDEHNKWGLMCTL